MTKNSDEMEFEEQVEFMSDYDKEIEKSAIDFMENECQMTDHYDDYKEAFKRGANFQKHKDAEKIKELELKIDLISKIAAIIVDTIKEVREE